MELDVQTVGKLYAPMVLAIGAVWAWWVKRDKRNHKLIASMVEKCEEERAKDREEHRGDVGRLQKRLDHVQDAHVGDLNKTLLRVAESLDLLARRSLLKKPNDPDTDIHPIQRDDR